MNEYIKRSSLLKEIEPLGVMVHGERSGKMWFVKVLNSYHDKVLEKIKEAPAESVVEVVRCKDCKHFSWAENQNVNHKCGMGFDRAQWISLNGFCSYGERRGDDAGK